MDAEGREERFQPLDRREWRQWLQENHDRSRGVWLIYYKQGSGKRTLTLDEAVLEAVAFGWIDGRMHRLDEERVELRFGPRRKGSAWSRSNKLRVERLIREGLMTPAGMAKVEEARRSGSWTVLDDVDDLVVPRDLEDALASVAEARERFDALSASGRKQLLGWIKLAKRQETRGRRITEVVRRCSGGNEQQW